MKKKLIVRSKSETDWFSDKQSLEIVNNNLKKMKNISVIKRKKEPTKKEEKEEKEDDTKKNKISPIKNNNLKAKNSLLNSKNLFLKFFSCKRRITNQ